MVVYFTIEKRIYKTFMFQMCIYVELDQIEMSLDWKWIGELTQTALFPKQGHIKTWSGTIHIIGDR
jgi:hypothetical protein